MYPQPGRSVGDRVELLLDEVVAVMTLVLSVLDTDVCLDDEDELELEETDPRSVVLLLVVIGRVVLLMLDESEEELVVESVPLLVLDEDDWDELELDELCVEDVAVKEVEVLDILDVERDPLLVLVEWEEELVVDNNWVLVLEEGKNDEVREVMELVTDDEMVESDVDRIVLEPPRTLDDEGSTTSLAPQTPELLFPVPIALCI
jgi:hypothetical protein